MEQKTVKIQSSDITARVFGSYDINVRTVEKAFSVKVYNRSDEDGDAVLSLVIEDDVIDAVFNEYDSLLEEDGE